MMLTVRSRYLLALFWGPRRATSNTRYGAARAYPSSVTANHRLWLIWLKISVREWVLGETSIVTPKSFARARVSVQVASTGVPVASQSPTPMTEAQITALVKERDQLRKDGRFEDADEIRNRLVAANVIVSDARAGCS